ncbi:MAG TPA: ABC-2 family transporter protein, partial [Bacillota bacterium]
MIMVAELLIPFLTLLIYGTGASFPGWSIYEMLLLQGIFMLSRGVAGLLFFGVVWNTLDRVREGTYDLLLIKPRSVLFLAVATGFEPDSIGTIAGGLMVMGFSLRNLTAPGMWEWLEFLVLFLFSVMVLFSFALFMAGSVFKWVGNSRVYEIFDSTTAFGNYPRSIFSRWFQAIISYILPLAAIGFFPAAVLLGKPTDGIFATMFVCLVFVGLSLAFWRWMLSKYTSAGG